MAVMPNGIPVRIIAVFGDAELPDGGVEIGTVDIPVTMTVSDEPATNGEVLCDVTADTSALQRIAAALHDPDPDDIRFVTAGAFTPGVFQKARAREQQRMQNYTRRF